MVKKFVLLWFMLPGMVDFLSAQTIYSSTAPRNNAALPFGVQDALLIDQLMVITPGFKVTSLDALREQSVKPYMMPVRRATDRGSELSYELASCLEFYKNLNENYKLNLSPDFITLNLTGQGIQQTPQTAFRFLADVGTVDSAILPYGSTNLTSAVRSALRYRITNFLQIFRDVTKPRQKIYEIRKALMRGNPIIIDFKADPSLPLANGAESWKLQGQATQFYPLVVVGFDEDKQALEVMGAWGSEWGKAGYSWISYDDFGELAMNGYVLIPTGF
jgi:hypothetical protein